MAKFSERDLAEKIERFNEKSTIELTLEGTIDARIKLENSIITFDEERGYINIESDEGKFQINTTLVYKYQEIRENIYIDLNDILVKIKKIS